jgi:hypothetical protein
MSFWTQRIGGWVGSSWCGCFGGEKIFYPWRESISRFLDGLACRLVTIDYPITIPNNKSKRTRCVSRWMNILWYDILRRIFMLKLAFFSLYKNMFLIYVSLFLSASVFVFSSVSLSLFLKSDNIPSSNVRTADHRALFWMRKGAYFWGAKAAGWWSWQLPVSDAKAYSWSYNITPPYTSMPWCLVRLEGKFTLDFPALLNVSYGSHPILFTIKQATFFLSNANIF